MTSENFLSDTVEALEAVIDLHSPDSFWLCEDIFQSIDRTAINAWARTELKKYKDSIHYESQRLSDNNIEVHESSKFRLVITVIDKLPKYLYIHPQDYFCRNIGFSNIEFDRYRPSKIVTPDIFDPTVTLKFESSGEIGPDKTLCRRGLHEVVDYKPNNQRMGLLLRLLSPNMAAFEWAFERETLKPWGITSAEPTGSHLVSLLRLVNVVGDEESLDIVRKCTEHPFHNVRWSAVETLCELNADDGLSVIEKLSSSDPHPEIRKAAKLTLEHNT